MIKRQTYISTKVLYSLDIPKIDYTTDYDKVCVSLYRNSGNYDNLYSGELLPYNGKVSLYDMKQLIEQFMLDKGMVQFYYFAHFYFSFLSVFPGQTFPLCLGEP